MTVTSGPHRRASQKPDSSLPEDLRNRLLESAVQEFAKRGFQATTTRNIADGAGASAGALYVHFKSKEDLLYHVILTGHTTLLESQKAAAKSSTDPAEQLSAVIRSYVLEHASQHDRAHVINYELQSLRPDHLQEVLAIRREMDFQTRFIIESGIRSGSFSTPEPRMTASAILSLTIDLARWFRYSTGWTPEQVADHYVNLSLLMVGHTHPEGTQHSRPLEG